MKTGKYLTWPTAGDRGSKAHVAVSNAIETLDTHSHNGIDSEKLSPLTLEKVETVILIADFALTNGEYKVIHNLPAGYASDTANIKYIIASGAELGIEIFPTVRRITSTQIEISLNINTFDLRVVVS